jgi:hypothetical protein
MVTAAAQEPKVERERADNKDAKEEWEERGIHRRRRRSDADAPASIVRAARSGYTRSARSDQRIS